MCTQLFRSFLLSASAVNSWLSKHKRFLIHFPNPQNFIYRFRNNWKWHSHNKDIVKTDHRHGEKVWVVGWEKEKKLKGEYLKWLLVPVICSMNERVRVSNLIYTNYVCVCCWWGWNTGSFKSNHLTSFHFWAVCLQHIGIKHNNFQPSPHLTPSAAFSISDLLFMS